MTSFEIPACKKKEDVDFEPQKLFIGLMDFFSILLPGALLTWLLMGEMGSVVLGDRYNELAGAQTWAAFVFASYLFGHLGFLLGSWLDEFYDRARRYTLNAQVARQAHLGRLLHRFPHALIWIVFKRCLQVTRKASPILVGETYV